METINESGRTMQSFTTSLRLPLLILIVFNDTDGVEERDGGKDNWSENFQLRVPTNIIPCTSFKKTNDTVRNSLWEWKVGILGMVSSSGGKAIKTTSCIEPSI